MTVAVGRQPSPGKQRVGHAIQVDDHEAAHGCVVRERHNLALGASHDGAGQMQPGGSVATALGTRIEVSMPENPLKGLWVGVGHGMNPSGAHVPWQAKGA